MKALIFALCVGSMGPVLAQTKDGTPARQLVRKGVRLYDEGNYPAAVAAYEQALAAAPGDATATSELALTYHALGRHAEAAALCEKLLQANPAADVSVYVTYGNSLDMLKRGKQAAQVYEQGLKYHPDSYSLYFNQGVAQAGTGQGPAAIGSFQRAVALRPDHATSHMSLGVMQLAGQARVPAILALARFLVLEPRGPRATQRLPLLDEAMMRGVARTGEKRVNVALTVEAVRDAGRNRRQPDNFGLTEMMLSLAGATALGKDSSAATRVGRFAEQFSWLCKSLAERKNTDQPKGFTWEYYVPYFVELEKKGYGPALAYLTHASQAESPEVQQWLAAHPAEVAVFQEWSKNYAWPSGKP